MIFKNRILSKASDLLISALYYILVWIAGMAYINKFLGLW